MSIERKKILFSVGEASADQHAAHLISELKKIDPNIYCYGMGGKLMREAGAEIFIDNKKMSVVGFFEVFKHLPEILQARKYFVETFRTNCPDLLILIDYPGFNLPLAKMAKKVGIKVLYYIPPQIWAWRKKRIKTIKKYVDQVAVIFPFELDFYQKEKINAVLVKNPIAEKIKNFVRSENPKKTLGLNPNQLVLGLFPGSRLVEIAKLLPTMIAAGKILKNRFPNLQLVLPVASSLSENDLARYQSSDLPVKIITNQTYQVISACDLIIATSGTVTLEIAIFKIPEIIIYRLAKFSYFLAKLLVKIPYIGLCNVVAGQKIVPELIQDDAGPEKIAVLAEKILSDEKYRQEMISDMKKMAGKLQGSEAKNIEDLI
jgi:lipid-A-disaccharide synthase